MMRSDAQDRASSAVRVVRCSDGWMAEGTGQQIDQQEPTGIDALLASLEQRGIVRMTLEL